MDKRNHVHETQETLDHAGDAIREADDALVSVLQAVQEDEDAALHIAATTKAITRAEAHLTTVKTRLAQLVPGGAPSAGSTATT